MTRCRKISAMPVIIAFEQVAFCKGIKFEMIDQTNSFKKLKLITMTLVKRNYKTLDNLFDEFLNSVPAGFVRDFNFAVPPVNVHETGDAYHLEVVAPGFKKEDFKVNLEKGMLSVSYEHKTENENKDYKTHRREFAVKSFKRSFSVDDNINTENIQAKYENGVLNIYLPKNEEVKVLPKEITIK